MFDVGFAEVFLLAVIGLLVLGPERLPGVARTLGGFVRKARMSWISLKNTIEAEMAEADLSKPIKHASDELKQIGKQLSETPAFKTGNQIPDPAASESLSTDAAAPGKQQDTDSEKSENV